MGKNEDFSKVIKVVTELADVTEQDVLGKSRVKEVVAFIKGKIGFSNITASQVQRIKEYVDRFDNSVS